MTTGRRASIAAVIAAMSVGAILGAASLFWIQDQASGEDEPAPTAAQDARGQRTPDEGGDGSSDRTINASNSAVLLAWTSGGLPSDFASTVAAVIGVDSVAEVRGDLVELARSVDADGVVVDDPPGGMVIPLDAIAIEPDLFSPFAGKSAAALLDLEPDEAVLSETSAQLRRLGVGSTLHLADGSALRVVAIVPDAAVAAAELVVLARADGPVTTPRYVLVSYTGDRAEVEAAVLAASAVGAPVRFRSGIESPILRHGDAVLPQASVKAQFGEFAYRRGGDGSLELDPAWTSEYLRTEQVPILGRVTCHRAVLPALRAALEELDADGNAWLVAADEYGGCFAPRIATNAHNVSRHTWGIAVDLNITKFPLGFDDQQDSRLVESMLDQGFVSGANWLVPDPAHFEWVQSTS